MSNLAKLNRGVYRLDEWPLRAVRVGRDKRAGSRHSLRSSRTAAMRRKRSLQSLVVAPEPPLGKEAANDGSEPTFTDTALRTNVWSLRGGQKHG